MADTTRQQCEAHKADGSRCRAHVLQGHAHCWAHEPAVRDAAQEARRLGGKMRHSTTAPRPPAGNTASVDGLSALVSKAIDDVCQGHMSAGAATAMASLCRTQLRIIEARGKRDPEAEPNNTADVEAEIARLEQRLLG